MIEPNQKYKVKNSNLVENGTIVTAEENRQIKGKPVFGMSGTTFLCKLPGAGSFFFREDQLELVE